MKYIIKRIGRSVEISEATSDEKQNIKYYYLRATQKKEKLEQKNTLITRTSAISRVI